MERLFARGEHLAVLLAVAGTPLVHYPSIGGPNPFVEAKTVYVVWVGAILALLRSLRIVSGAPPKALGRSVMGALAAISVAAAAVSLLRGNDPQLFFRESLLQWSFLLWLWLLTGVAEPARCLELCLAAEAVAGGIVAAVGLAQFISPQSMLSWLPYGSSAGDTRNLVFSSLGNPEYLGGYLAVVLVLDFCLVLRIKSALGRLVLGLAALLEIVVLLLTGARGAWLGAVAGVAVTLGMAKPKSLGLSSRKLLAALALAGALTVAVFVVFSTPNPLNPYRVNLWGRVLELGNPRSESVRHRVVIATAAARAILRHPVLGVGPGRFGVEFYRELEEMLAKDENGAVASYVDLLQGRAPDHAHNDALEVWIEMGTVGFVIFLAIVAWGLALMRRGGLALCPRAWAVRAAAAISLALLVESLFSFPFHLPARGIVFWTFFGLGAAAGERLMSGRLADEGAKADLQVRNSGAAER